jgi:hypothetical protein
MMTTTMVLLRRITAYLEGPQLPVQGRNRFGLYENEFALYYSVYSNADRGALPGLMCLLSDKSH